MKKPVQKSQSRTSDRLVTKDVAEINRPRSFVFYGRSGTGKTTISSTFPKPLLFLDVKDQGTDSISDVKGIRVREINSWDDFEETYWYLQKHPDEFKTIVIDTVSQLQSLVVEKVLNDKKKDASKAGDWGSMTKREWGDVAQIMKSWIVNIRDLPMEVVFLAQDRVFNLDEDGAGNSEEEILTPEVGPRLSPSVASTLNAAVSVVGNTFVRIRRFKKEINGKIKEKEKKEYCLRIGPNPIYVTKLRKPKSIELPDVIVNPEYEDLMAAIKGELE